MKPKRNNYCIPSKMISTLLLMLFPLSLISCSKNDPEQQKGEIKGSVKDESGNPYPGTLVTISKESEQLNDTTESDGEFQTKTNSFGTYALEIRLPLSTQANSLNPDTVNVDETQAATVDFVISPQPAKAHLNFGTVQLLEEIVDKDGHTPSAPDELLFAKNIFDAPIGQLNEIKAPDGHQITLSEFQTASGELLVHCNGNSSTIQIALTGMIPNGTYTFWLAYLNKTRKVGEQIDFGNDFVNFTNPPIGASSGTENIAIADADGTISVTLKHASCILTDEVALVIPVLYHINGKTFGGGHVPDPEEMAHMLVYFQ